PRRKGVVSRRADCQGGTAVRCGAAKAPSAAWRGWRPRLYEVDREGEYDCGAALAGNVEQGCGVAELHCLRHRGGHPSSLEELLRRLLLALRIDDLGAPRALGFGLAGDRTDHAFVEVDALDLDVGNLDSPTFGLLVENLLNVAVQLVALRQHVIE